MMQFKKVLSNRCGFTLMELIVVIAILAILVGGTIGITSGFSGGENPAIAKQVLADGTIYRPLVQLPDEGILGGVCAGIAYKWEVDPWIPRFGFILCSCLVGTGVLAYLGFLFFLDESSTPADYMQRITNSS